MPFFGVPIRNGLPIGLGSVAGFGAPQEFTPAELFIGGTAGTWYDPSDLTTMFTTSAGTTPVAMPGQGLPAADSAVGAVLDKRAPAYSVFFDGNGDELSAGSSANFAFGTGAYTVEFWVYLTAAVGAGHQPCFVFIPPTNGWGIWNENGGGQLSIRSSGVGNVVTSTTTLAAGQWYHVAAVRSGTGAGQTSIFLNGTRVANGTDATNWTVQGPLQVGGITVPNYYVTGYMSNARVVKGTAVYDPAQSTLTVPTAPLSPISGTSLLTCGTTWSGNPAITSVGNTRVDGLNPFTASPVGNHAIAINDSTARPELRARVNLLTYSEEFDNAAWVKTGTTVTANIATAPNGTTTADSFSHTTTSGFPSINQAFAFEAITYACSIYFKYVSNQWVRVDQGSFIIWFDVLNGVVGATGGSLGTLVSSSAVPAGNGWYKCTFIVAKSAQNSVVQIQNVDADNSSNRVSGTSTLIWGADLRPANIGAAVPAYQRIADANTYDTNGFPLYLWFDGADDGMYTPANLNLTATDKVGVFAGVRKLAQATGQQIAELGNVSAGGWYLYPGDRGTATGSFFTFLGRGTAADVASQAAQATPYAAPISAVLAATGDISGDLNTLRVNAVAAASATGDQGAGNYGTYPLYIGSRANSSLWFQGQVYGLVIVGSAVSAGNISATESWMAGKTGIVI